MRLLPAVAREDEPRPVLGPRRPRPALTFGMPWFWRAGLRGNNKHRTGPCDRHQLAEDDFAFAGYAERPRIVQDFPRRAANRRHLEDRLAAGQIVQLCAIRRKLRII